MGYFLGYIIIIILGFVFHFPTVLLAILISGLIYFLVYSIWLKDTDDEYSNESFLNVPHINPYLTRLLEQKDTLNQKLAALEKLSEMVCGEAKQTFADTLRDANLIMDANLRCAKKRFVFLSTEKEVDTDSHRFLENVISSNNELLSKMNFLLVSLTEIDVEKRPDVKSIEDLAVAIKKLNVEEW